MTLLSLAVVSTLLAQVPPASGARYERPIVVTAPGPQRVAVDATLLAGGAPFTVVRRSATHEVAEGGLSDLRLSGPDGREVPYLLAYRAATEPHWLRAAVQPIAPTDKTSGFEADLGSI
jgi:hypothetical protein